MEFITYTLEVFSADLAKRGRLCVVTSYGYSEASISSDSGSFKKACIPTPINDSEFSVLVDGVTMVFDRRGYPVGTPSKSYQIFLASTTKEAAQPYGNAIKRSKKVTTTRTADGVITTVEEYTPTRGADDAEKNVLVSNLNARDNFAIQALKGILQIIPDLKNLGDDERDYYCKLAYQWAANMMDNAAQARATFVDETHSTEQSTNITELETNQEKLLNNILFTMERAQQIAVDGENQIISDRIVNPELNGRIDKLETAIKAQTTAITNQTTAINSLKNTINATLERIAIALEGEEVESIQEEE